MPPPREIIFWRGTTGRCPRCESPEIFKSHFRLVDRCPRCGLPLELEDGWSYGSVPLAYVLACIVWVVPVTVLTIIGVFSFLTGALVGMIGVIILPIITYRFTKRLWVGLYYALLPNEMRERRPGQKGDEH